MPMTLIAVAWLGGCAKTIEPEPTPATTPAPLIPRTELFGNVERSSAKLRPDGQQLGFLAPVDGVLNVWLSPVDALDEAKPLTDDRGRGIRGWGFLYDNAHVYYIQDDNGDENWRLHLVNLQTGEDRIVTPEQSGVTARIYGTSPEHPDTLVVGLNDRDPRFHDLYRLQVKSGERTLLFENDGYIDFDLDDDLEIAVVGKPTPDGGQAYFVRDGEDLVPLVTFDQVDSMVSGTIEVADGRVLVLDSRERDTAALKWIDLRTREQTVVGTHERVDVGNVVTSEVSSEVLGYGVNYVQYEWVGLDEAFAADLEVAKSLGDGRLFVSSATADESKWIWGFDRDDGPFTFYLYDREAGSARPLFTSRPWLDDASLVPMQGVVIPARDGLELVSYLSLPAGSDADGDFVPESPVPMVLLVHGGPWGRDSFGFDSQHQWLANRGYAVLSVNFRGSTGFGKSFVNAADLQWGRKMHDDLLDAVDWAVARGITGADQVAIMGGSYGGYATLAGLAFTPERFACGVDIVGPSNLQTLLSSIPPYWEPMLEMFATRVGDPRTEEGKALLQERSPLFAVDQIVRPLLIGQGANDPRVKQAESDQIVEAMSGKGIPVTYALFPDEGHGFARPENRTAFLAVAEHFLAECLGGRAEPLGEVVRSSSMEIRHGAELIEGLATALPQAE